MEMTAGKDWLKARLRSRNVTIRDYRFTVSARKQQLLKHFEVDLLVDVGANRGQAATLYRQHGYGGRILSLEPDRRALVDLERKAAKDPRWDVIRTAVGQEPGQMQLHLSEESQFTSLVEMGDYTVRASPHARYVDSDTVQVDTLDSLLADQSSQNLALKIDVQGFEREVLAGAPKSMAQAVYVDIELCPVPLYEGQILMLELVQLMEDLGFTLAAIEDTYSDTRTGRVLAYNGVYARL